ncbi:phosphate-starvation-inducible protein PsiE [Oceanibacterium hippocampi]|uniref:Protein PsiE n=1 Tax=Oceanibacterium hippocampi TaxID=745714 RepID=A0A1Y5TYU2_9PROT|nr:phosphate-starvation-inducible PsiE family protein [Oceanibacterium hippocampi]SLN73858.1 Protein PsiE [Oceanibacterium hippocampi]
MAEKLNGIEERLGRAHSLADKVGTVLVNGFHVLALFAIGATIVWAAGFEFLKMFGKGHATVEDILLLFIFLELGAMVGIYFSTNHMPVRFLIYVALTAMTRLLIGMVNLEHVDLMEAIQHPHLGLLVVTGGIMMLAISVLVLRYASFKYPSARPVVRGGVVGRGTEDMA